MIYTKETTICQSIQYVENDIDQLELFAISIFN